MGSITAGPTNRSDHRTGENLSPGSALKPYCRVSGVFSEVYNDYRNNHENRKA